MHPHRIAPLEGPYPDAIQKAFDIVMPAGMEPLRLFRTLARNPRVLQRFMRGGLLDRGSITIREREIVILRTTSLCGSEYEWGVHVAAYGERAGFSPEALRATVGGEATDAVWSPSESLLIEMCDQLHRSSALDDGLLERMHTVWKPDQILELLVLAGLYHAVSFVTNGAHVELEQGAPRFPS